MRDCGKLFVENILKCVDVANKIIYTKKLGPLCIYLLGQIRQAETVLN